MLRFQANVIDALVEGQPGSSEGENRRRIPLPFTTEHYPRNEMSIPLRLLWIGAIASGAAFSAAIYLAGLESLARRHRAPLAHA